MMGWKEYNIEDLCNTISETYRGNDNDVILINTSDVLGGKILNHIPVPNENLKGQFKKTFRMDDILYSEIRPANRRFAFVDIEDTSLYIASTKLMVLRPNRELTEPKFLFALLSSKNMINELQARAESRSGTFPQITFGSELAPIKVMVPDKDIQLKIVSFLEAFQYKLDTNEAINRNLEEQAKAIFKEWFIDNADSSWTSGTFSDLIISTLGGDWGKEEETGNYVEKVYCVRGADIPEVKAGNKGKMPTRYILTKNLVAKQLVAGDIVVEISGGSPTQSTGRVASIAQSLLDRYDTGMVCTNFCRALKPINGYSMFVYYYWQYLYDKNIFFLYENGTTGIKNLDIKGFLENEEIVIPPKELVLKLDDLCHSIFDQIFKNGICTEKLVEMRDSLLPKLMSGELDVSELDI